jgi:hypothetical protein
MCSAEFAGPLLWAILATAYGACFVRCVFPIGFAGLPVPQGQKHKPFCKNCIHASATFELSSCPEHRETY